MSFALNAFSADQFSCEEIYIKTMNHKTMVKEKMDRINNASPGLLIVTAAVNPAAGLILLGSALGTEIYASTPSKEERILRLASESNKQLKKLVKKLQKDVSCEITEDEVKLVIQKGINSGIFCENFPVLYNVSDVKRHVTDQMIIKYH